MLCISKKMFLHISFLLSFGSFFPFLFIVDLIYSDIYWINYILHYFSIIYSLCFSFAVCFFKFYFLGEGIYLLFHSSAICIQLPHQSGPPDDEFPP